MRADDTPTRRNTPQRKAVRASLDAQPGFVSAQELHARLREGSVRIGLATVYRALADLAASGEADTMQSAEGESLYRACTPGRHHHHLICRSCGLTVEVDAAPVESWAAQVGAAHGFTRTEHVVDVFGLCADSSRA